MERRELPRYPVIDAAATGRNLCRLRLEKGYSVKELQEYLGLGCPQGVYQWQAGRKKKFTDEDIAQIRVMRECGMTIQEVADQFGTSRQIVSKYLNMAPETGYTMRMTLMYQNKPCTAIDVNFLENKIKIQNYTKDILHRAFGTKENPTWDDFRLFLEDRCFPKTRGNVKPVLAKMGLQDYDPLQIVEKTHGRTAEDDLWVKFQYYGRMGA